MRVKWYIVKIMSKLLGKTDKQMCDKINELFRSYGMAVGENCRIYSNILTSESFLIELGGNITISNDVQLVTHDNSIIKADLGYTDLFGKIKIGSNSFVGARSIIMGGVEIGENVIVASGSVVTHSIPDGVVVAGNPARVISTVEKFRQKHMNDGFNIEGLSQKEIKQLIENNEDKLQKRRYLL